MANSKAVVCSIKDADYYGAILIDTDYWAVTGNYAELTEWALENGAELQGMTISFRDEESAMLFKMLWG